MFSFNSKRRVSSHELNLRSFSRRCSRKRHSNGPRSSRGPAFVPMANSEIKRLWEVGSTNQGAPGLGAPVPRVEDLRLVRGYGKYTDDIALPNQLYAVMVRSPYAHAIIRNIDTSAAS